MLSAKVTLASVYGGSAIEGVLGMAAYVNSWPAGSVMRQTAGRLILTLFYSDDELAKRLTESVIGSYLDNGASDSYTPGLGKGQANAQKCLLALAEQSGPQFELGPQNGWGTTNADWKNARMAVKGATIWW